ncbi:PREDICTED: TNFAIP3-interacting protein 2 [Gavialis gangeticus]|uniref:TNFAIP3-interacting protein 2 n=1 Tax=Gavialis gangeticus TaxID=94835 RepID=UPI00092E6B16|nr:PREDICTED: TNFAIP3-interacting protein 2 [Gavialis gangeticus]
MRLAGSPLSPADAEQQQRARGRAMGEGGGVEALQEALEKLQRENRSLRAKVPRYHALCGLYHEAGQQLKHLQVQLAAKDALVRELRAGLAGEAAAPARSLVDSLVEQLSQVKQQLRERDWAAAQEAEVRSQEVQKLKQQLEEKEREMQQIVSQPQHEREKEILRLKRSLAEREKVQATSEVLCRSLTDETHQLQRKLASTAEMCQHLAKCLEDTQKKGRRHSEELIPTERSNQPSEKEPSLQTIICKLQEENRMLKQKVVHVEDLNAKWQKYDASRDEYVKRLHLQLKELKSQPEQQLGITSLQTNSDLMQKEIVRLNKLLEEKMNECSKAKRELEDVQKARAEDSERIQMLEQQVLVYKDDFTSERADRERAQSKIQELQAENARLQHQLNRRQDSRETAGHFRVQIDSQNHMYIQTNVEHLLGTSQVQSCARRAAGSQSALQAGELQAAAAIDHGSSAAEGRGQGELRCPHCMRFFSDELSEEFLKHVAECCQ